MLKQKKKKISIIVPCYNEEENIRLFYSELLTVWKSITADYELIFVNDGSADKTVLNILSIKKGDSNVKIIDLTRNFGKEVAVTAGLNLCTGDAAVIVDADLQYPLDSIPDFISAWSSGSKHVVGLRDNKNTKNVVEKIGSKVFNSLMKLGSEIKTNSRALDFRLLDRAVIDNFNYFTERGRIVRTLLDWLGYEPVYIPYKEQERYAGKTAYTLEKRIELALNAFVSHSTLPLKIVGMLGVLITTSSLILGVFIIVDNIFSFGLVFSGTFMLGTLNTFLIGLVLSSLGLISYYIGSIKKEVLSRPLYVLQNPEDWK